MDKAKERLRHYLGFYGKISILGACIFLVYGIGVWTHGYSHEHKLSVSFFDVGQGDSIFIITPSGHTMIIDGGPGNAVLSEIHKKISFFTKDIDVMIATHPDADHITGLIPVLEAYRIKHLIVSPTHGSTDTATDLDKHIQQENAVVHIAEAGDVIDFQDGVTVSILYPKKGYVPTKDTNDGSVSIFLNYGSQSFLLTGDLPSKEEPYLLPYLPKAISVYKAGHHGSKTSSSELLLSYIHPTYAVISAGKNNRYGHPSGETLERLHMYAKETMSTIEKGTISFVSDGNDLEVETEK